MLSKRIKPRIFDYEPRFYKPENDEKEKRKKKLRFRYSRKVRRKTTSPIVWFILILVVLYIYLRFNGYVD